MDKDCDTQRASRMLVLWLDLQNALRTAEAAQGRQPRLCPNPWEHESQRVRAVWNRITEPQNEGTLWEWLSVVGPGQDEAWAHEAIRECQRRKQGR
jgi:hypothetical protein